MSSDRFARYLSDAFGAVRVSTIASGSPKPSGEITAGTVGSASEPPMMLWASVRRRRAPGPKLSGPPSVLPMTGPDGERRIAVILRCSVCNNAGDSAGVRGFWRAVHPVRSELHQQRERLLHLLGHNLGDRVFLLASLELDFLDRHEKFVAFGELLILLFELRRLEIEHLARALQDGVRCLGDARDCVCERLRAVLRAEVLRARVLARHRAEQRAHARAGAVFGHKRELHAALRQLWQQRLHERLSVTGPGFRIEANALDRFPRLENCALAHETHAPRGLHALSDFAREFFHEH